MALRYAGPPVPQKAMVMVSCEVPVPGIATGEATADTVRQLVGVGMVRVPPGG